MQFTMTEARKVAVGAARSVLRRHGYDLLTATHEQAWTALQDLTLDLESVAGNYVLACSDSEYRNFQRAWKRDVNAARGLRGLKPIK